MQKQAVGQSTPAVGAGVVAGLSEGCGKPRAAIQPGLLPALRLYIVLSTIVPLLGWRWLDPVLGIRGPLFKVARPSLFFFVLLMITLRGPGAAKRWAAHSCRWH